MPSLLYCLLSFFLCHSQELEVPPVVEWACPISGEKEEHRCPCHWDEIEGQENDEFKDLSQRERRVDSGCSWLLHAPERVFSCRIYFARRRNKIFVALVDEDSVKDVYERLIYEEGFEEKSDDCCPFSEDKECTVDQGKFSSMEYSQESDLG